MTAKATHPFEQAGLGIAPFRLIGVSESKYQACPGAPIQPGGSCDYCGTAIMFVALVKSADGKQFKIGCDCAAKLGREDNVDKSDPVIKEISARRAALAVATRKANEKKRISDAIENFATHRATFERMANPERDGESMADRIVWFFDNAGTTGKMKIVRYIESVVKDIDGALQAAPVMGETLAQIRQREASTYLTNNPGVMFALWALDSGFARDITRKLLAFGYVTERQAAALLKNAAEFIKTQAEEAARGPKTPCVEGKGVEVTGKVLMTKSYENEYGSTLKMLVLDDRGFKVFCTVPAVILHDEGGMPERISFVVNIERSVGDKYFGYGKRPRKAVAIETAEA